MKKVCLAILVGVVVLAAMAPAAAQYNRAYFGSVISTGNQMANGKMYVRYYVPGYSTVSPSGGWTTCPYSSVGATVTWEPTLTACELRYLPGGAGGYNGYQDNLNKDQLPGAEHYVLFDFQSGAGAANHTGYYFWARRTVNNSGDPSAIWNGTNCTGTLAGTCLGQGNNTTSTGYSLSNTPLGTLNPLGGLRPIPVPIIVSVQRDPDPGTDAAISVNWFLDARGWSLDSGGAGADFGAAKYSVVGLAKAVRTTPSSHCESPTEAEFDVPLAGDVSHQFSIQSGTTLAAHVADFGKTKNDAFCYYFALKVVYNATDFTSPVTSLYYSANSNSVVFGGLASGMTNMSAEINKGKVATITWKTTLSECVRGYNVLRSFSRTGPFVQVNRALIPDKGGPAVYTYLDVLRTPEKELWYEVEAISCDQSTERTPAFEARKK